MAAIKGRDHIDFDIRGSMIKERMVIVLSLLMGVPLASAISDTVLPGLNDSSISGQIPQEEWNRTFGGSGDDVGTYGQQTKDGGFIITGYTSSYGTDAPFSWLIKAPYRGDIWLIKTDAKGNKEWDRTIGGLGKELGFFVQQTRDDGYILVGGKKSFWIFGSYDVLIVKTDSKGNLEWERSYDGWSGEDLGFSVQQSKDGGYIIAGYATSTDGKKAWIIKTDSLGKRVWSLALGKTDSEAASVQLTDDGGYIITGYTPSYGSGKEDVLLIKTDAEGKWWLKSFGGSSKDLGMSVQETRDGGYIITGLTESFGAGKGDIWLIKTNSAGDKEWDKTFGNEGFEMGSSVRQTSDGGYIITGSSTISSEGEIGLSQLFGSSYRSRAWLIKTDSKGNELWNETFGGTSSDWGNFAQETQDGGYIIAGVTKSYGAGKEDVWLIKVR